MKTFLPHFLCMNNAFFEEAIDPTVGRGSPYIISKCGADVKMTVYRGVYRGNKQKTQT